jgi:hypothetical protein
MSANEELAATLQQVEEVRQRTRVDVHPIWFPMVLFGVLGILSTPFLFVWDGAGMGLYWLVAGPAGGVATARYYRNRALSLGAGVRGGAYVAIGVAILVGAWVGGAVSESAAVPLLAVSAGYLGFAWLDKSWPVAGVAAVLAVTSAVFAITDPAHGDVLLTVFSGAAFTVTGLLLRRGGRD